MTLTITPSSHEAVKDSLIMCNNVSNIGDAGDSDKMCINNGQDDNSLDVYINNYKEENMKLASEISRLNDELDKLKQSECINNYKEENTKLTSEISRLNDELDKLKQSEYIINNYKEENTKLASEISRLNDELDKLKQSEYINNYKEECTKLASEISKLNDELDKLRQSSQQKQEDSSMISMLKLCLNDSNKHLNKLIEELKTAENEAQHLKLQLNDTKGQNNRLETDCAKLYQEKVQLEASKKISIDENIKLEDYNKQLNHKLIKLQNYKSMSDYSFDRLETINNDLMKSNVKLDSQCAINESIIGGLEHVVNSQTYEIRELKEKIDNHQCTSYMNKGKEKLSVQEDLLKKISFLEKEHLEKDEKIEQFVSRSNDQEKEIARLKSMYSKNVGKLELELDREIKISEACVNKVYKYNEIIRTLIKENEDLKNLREKEQDEKAKQVIKCKICFEEPITHCFSPCYHFVACGKCASKVETCVVCRSQIIEYIKIYF
nr:2983_t:CDS:2 [Entrophospora candida]